MNWNVPFFQPDITEDDIQAAIKPLHDSWMTMGPVTQQFEEAFSGKIKTPYSHAVCNGTAALHIALVACDIKPGDEVLVPSLTFVACANVILAQGATPIFIDCTSKEDWTISPDDIEQKISPNTKAMMVVHYAGFPCNMETITTIAKKHDLKVIEDCAHAVVTKDHDRFLGNWGDVGCFSFFSNKNMTTGEGGMVVTQNQEIANRIKYLRSHGMTVLSLDKHKGRAATYDVVEPGFNYRIDEIRSSIGLSQLNRLDDNLAKRKHIYDLYIKILNKIDEVSIPFLETCAESVGYHIFPILINVEGARQSIIDALKTNGIQTSIHYPPIHLFSGYQAHAYTANCPLTEHISANEITLPFYPSMTDEQVIMVCDGIKEALHNLPTTVSV